MAFGVSYLTASSHLRQARVWLRTLLAVAGSAALCGSLAGQTTVLLPGTITSIAGSAPIATTSGTACTTGSPLTATSGNGDGCPAVNAKFPGNETAIAVDLLGNVYISANSSNPQIIRRIDARTGLITQFAGFAGSQCASGNGTTIYGTKASQTDKLGDGCPVSASYGMNGPVSLGVDPYGNVLIASTGDLVLHMVCNAVSPACSATAAGENLMINVAGCSTSYSSFGVAVANGGTVGSAGDGDPATQTLGTSCATTAGGLGGRIYGVVADKWDNIYFADATNFRFRVVAGAPSITVNGTTIVNPLYATLATSTGTGLNYSTTGTNPLGVHQGYIYPIAGGGTVCTATGADTGGDGCPFTQTIVSNGGSGAYLQGVAVDSEGDFVFADGLGRLRVIYEGGTLIKGALSTNGITNPQLGYSYALIAGTTGAINYNSADPGLVKGVNAALQSGAIQTLAVDPGGNILIGDQIQVLFYDIATGYVRRLGANYNTTSGSTNAATTAGSACATGSPYNALDTIGDGCTLGQALYGSTNSALYLSEDGAGNLYMLDKANHQVRRVSTTLQPTTAVKGAYTNVLNVHSPVTGSAIAISAGTGSDFTVGSTTCSAVNTDGSQDCTASLNYAPSALNQRNDAITVATTLSGSTSTQTLGVSAISTGSALVFDPSSSPATSTLSSATTGITAIAMDGSGNSYVSGTQGITRISPSGVATLVNATSAAYIAVDTAGNVYTSSSTKAAPTSTITKYTYTATNGSYDAGTSITIPFVNLCTTTTSSISCASTQAYGGPLAVDALGAIYFVDAKHLQAFKISQNGLYSQQLTQTAFSSPSALTQDSYGNLLVLDGTTVLEVPAAGYPVTTASPLANTPIKLSVALTAPTGIAVDQGENVYIADTVSGVNTIKVQSASNYAQTATNYQYTVPGVTGTAVAVDGFGNLYAASSAVGGITKVARNAETFSFGTNVTESYFGVFLNTGGSNATGFTQTDTTTDFTESAPTTPLSTGAPTCSFSSTALAAGGLCNVSFTFTPTQNGTGDTPNTITLLPASNTLGLLALDATKNGSTATTTTAITGNTTGLIYTTGTETTFTVTVTETPAAVPTGTVAVTLDSGTAVNYPLTQASSSSATATVTISGLSAGIPHTIAAAYAASSGIAGSSSGNTSFTISPATTSVTWSPNILSIPYSQAIGTAILSATATSPAKSGTVPGVYIYTATPPGGSAQNIHSASYLPVGTGYQLGVTFVPNDAVDYQGSTSTVSNFNVTQASTTAGLGATQTLVAADGTGNYTSVQAAVNALASGGSIYIKPGTYTGDVTVVQPNISLRGLGGDPTKVVLTHSGGAFGNGQTQNVYAGEFNSSQNNGSQLPAGSLATTGDEASATLVVARGVNTALSTTSQIPNNFYAENLTLANTFNTDPNTTTTTYIASGSTCTAGNSPAYSYQYLYNHQMECGSQALALWTTSDLAVMNNVYATSQQDTVYAASPGSGSSGQVPSRQYWFRGKITGDVDFLFGDAAAVFDSTSIYTTWHGTTATGTETIEAQNQSIQTGASNGYLSGYIMNDVVFTSQSSGMTALYFGRPYGTYSTWVMLNSYIDQVNSAGYTTGLGPTLQYSTYLEYNNIPYTDPASVDINGVAYLGTGGSSGSGVTGTREAGLSPTSTNPGTPEAGNSPSTTLTQAQAQAYFPTNFLSQTVSSAISSTTNWNPTAALASYANTFVGSGTTATAAGGKSVTILMRPQTPGLGAIVPSSYSASSPTPVVFTIPTGTYTLSDTIGGNTTTLASGSLDASGEAYYTTSALAVGSHSLTWTYSGDANFAGSTSSTYTLTVSPATTTTVLSGAGITYGQTASIQATVASGAGTPTGNVTLTIDGTATQTQSLSAGVASFSVTGLTGGSHSFTAAYAGSGSFAASTTTSAFALVVTPAALTVTGACANRLFDRPNVCSATVAGYQYGDSAATVFASTPTGSGSGLQNAIANTYNATAVATLSAAGSMNYTLTLASGTYTVTGGTPQLIIFSALPNFAHGGSYQLTAFATSGLAIAYTVTTGSGIASISGTTLTVTGTGAVTIQAATAADPTGDYAAATAVSKSFIAK